MNTLGMHEKVSLILSLASHCRVLVRTDSPADTSKQSSDSEGPLVTFRSMAGWVHLSRTM